MSQSHQQSPSQEGGAFPLKLHRMLEDAANEGNEWIVSWQPNGRSFLVHKRVLFMEKIMPKYWRQSRYASFQRQLNLYGFARLTKGQDKGAYCHDLFVRGQVHLCHQILRLKIKGSRTPRALTEGEPPDFSKMTGCAPLQESNMTSKCIEEPKHPDQQVSRPPSPRFSASADGVRKEDCCILGRHEEGFKAAQEAHRRTLQEEVLLEKTHSEFDAALTVTSTSIKPSVAEVSDSEEDTSLSCLQQRTLPRSNPPAMTSKLGPLMPSAGTEIKAGDVLFFEGKPFRYLEHV